MKVFVIVEESYSRNGNSYCITIVAAFKTEMNAKGFIEKNNWTMRPTEPDKLYCTIEEKEIKDGSQTVSFLRFKNSLGYLNNPRVYFQKNDALIEKMRIEYHKWKANEYYIINSDVDFHEVAIQ